MKRLIRLIILTTITLSCLSLQAGQFSDSVRVHFRINQTEIDSLLMGNDASLRDFAQRMSDLSGRSDMSVKIDQIVITGAASPEGSIAVNDYLSRERAAAITRWLHGYLEFPDTLPQYVFKGRDWQGLLRKVEGDPDVPHKKEVIDLLIDIRDDVGMHPGASAKKRDGVARLKALHAGEPYRYLWRKHFPQLRASEVFIDATVESIDICGIATCGDSIEVADTIQSADVVIVPETIVKTEGRDMSHSYVFALKTNMLYDAALLPNIGAEFPVGNHFSVGANWMYAWWQNHERNRHWRIYGGDINARYYFADSEAGSLRPITGHHVGVYGQVMVFQVAFGGKGYITGIPGENLWGKPYIGGGIEYGYSKRVGKRLNIDFSLGLGYMAGEYRVYRHIDDHYVWQSSRRRNWFGPTKAEISLVWLIGKGVAK